jgi:hypothetical protein
MKSRCPIHRGLAVLLLLCVLATRGAAAEKPMNVLLLVSDDLNSWLLENPERYTGKVIAPNLKALGESGVNFKYAYTAAPVCSPSRTAFFSGVAPWKSGVYNNAQMINTSEALVRPKPPTSPTSSSSSPMTLVTEISRVTARTTDRVPDRVPSQQATGGSGGVVSGDRTVEISHALPVCFRGDLPGSPYWRERVRGGASIGSWGFSRGWPRRNTEWR